MRCASVRLLGLLVLLGWIGVAWAFWLALTVRPTQTIRLDLQDYTFVTVPAGTPITVINPNRDELAFLDPGTGKKEVILRGDMMGVSGMTASRDRKTVVTFNTAGTATVWRIAENGETTAFPLPRLAIGVSCSPDGKLVATRARDWRVRLWDVASHQELAVVEGNLGAPSGNAFFPDSGTLAVVSLNTTLWDVETRRPRRTLWRRARFYTIAP